MNKKEKAKSNQTNKPISGTDNKPISMAGKTYEEMLPSLLSGESDDISNEFIDEIL